MHTRMKLYIRKLALGPVLRPAFYSSGSFGFAFPFLQRLLQAAGCGRAGSFPAVHGSRRPLTIRTVVIEYRCVIIFTALARQATLPICIPYGVYPQKINRASTRSHHFSFSFDQLSTHAKVVPALSLVLCSFLNISQLP